MLEPLQGAAGRGASENQPGGDARVCPAEAGTRALLHGLADNLLSSKGPGCRPQTGRLLDLRGEGWSLSGVRSTKSPPESCAHRHKEGARVEALLESVKNTTLAQGIRFP